MPITTIAPKSIFECCLICSIAKNAITSIAIIQIAPITVAMVLMILATAEPAESISVFAWLANFEAMLPEFAKALKGKMQKLKIKNLSFEKIFLIFVLSFEMIRKFSRKDKVTFFHKLVSNAYF